MISYTLHRWYVSDKGILGDLCRSDEMMCFTLEPPFRKEDGAVPEGRYPLYWTRSPRLGKFTPRLGNVKGRDGILIHAGNTIKDSEGCILVGAGWTMTPEGDITLETSRAARDEVYDAISHDLDGGYAELTITRDPEV